MKKFANHPKKYMIIALVCFLMAILLNVLARYVGGFAQWYATYIYPLFVVTVSRVMSVFPFSVIEIVIYVAVLASIYFVWKTVRCVINEKNKIEVLKQVGQRLVCFVSVLILICTFTCTINYHRDTFSTYSGLEVRDSSVEELTSLCEFLIEECNRIEKEVTLDKEGYCVLPKNSRSEAADCMQRIGNEYDVLNGYYPKPKGIMTSSVMSYQMLAGVYSAFTLEANYNADMPKFLIPQTMCHELSHLKGFMREDEAEFIGYIACMTSQKPEFLYSASMNALVHCLNSLYKVVDMETYAQIYGKLSEENKRHLQFNREYWNQYKGVVSEISDVATDVFLKVNNQKDGMQSYGRMVDLLLAYYRE